MLRRIVALVTALLFLFSYSCTSSKLVTPTKIKAKSDHIIAVVLTNGDVVEFDKIGGRLDKERQEVHGYSIDGKEWKIPYQDIVSATVQRTSGLAVFGIVIIAIIFVVIIIAAASDSGGSSSSTSGSSCPYVYAFDGSDYVLDAEPLSGAISKGLERNDLCRLDHVRAHDGRYELLVRNELEETQYLDGMRLRVVDHPGGSEVYTDMEGSLHAVTEPVAAAEARDERGVDLRKVLASADYIPWQSIMPTDESWRDVTLRHELTFSFPKPADTHRGHLIVRAATSQWGSVMMREMMQARGDGLGEWRRSVDGRGPAMAEMIEFNMREELYFLKLEVLEGDQWVQRGWVPGGGPAMAETRVVPIDLSGVTGDTVKMRVQPPRGFWAFDYVAMSYNELPTPASTEVALKSATLADGTDTTPVLSSDDGAYHEMHNVGESMLLTFDAPRSNAVGARSIFLDTRGYYHSHVDETQPEQSALIAEMLDHEGAIVRYSLQKYVEFASQTAAAR